MIGDVDDRLDAFAAVALCGGIALCLLGHVAFRLRTLATLNCQRLVAIASAALIPGGVASQALITLTLVTALLCALIAYEAAHFRDTRVRVRARTQG